MPEPSSAEVRIVGQLTLEAADIRRAVDHEPLRRWMRRLLETRLGKSADAIKRAQPFWKRQWVLTLWVALMTFWTVISLVFEGR